MRRRFSVLLAALTLVGGAFVVGPTSTAEAQTGQPAFITGPGNRTSPHVVTYDATGHALSGGFMAFGGRPVGARVAAGDVNGDLQPEIVVGVGSGEASFVSVFNMSGTFVGGFSPYGGFPGGVNVAVGDVDGDAVDEIITGAGAGGGPHVIVWDFANGTATAKYGWFAYDPGFRGGVNISAFDLVNSARADIVTAPGAGGGPHVRVWDLGSGAAVEDAGWMAYTPGFTGGVSVGGGSIDGARAVVTGAGPGGGPHVRIFSTHGALKKEFYAYSPNFHGGVNVILATAQGGSLGHVITAPASWAGPHVRGFNSNGQELFGFMAYGGNTINGINLARVPQLGSTNNTNQNGTNSSS